MIMIHASNRKDIQEAFAGDIVALAGLNITRTGDTLCDIHKHVTLETMKFPEPVIEMAVEPKSKADQEKIGVALAKLAAEDPAFRVSPIQETGQTILEGMGELQLDIKVDISSATTRSTPTSARRRSPIAKADQEDRDQVHPQEAVRRLRPVRQGPARVRAGRKGTGSRSKRRSSAERFQRNIFRASKRASTASSAQAFSRATPSSTSRRSWWTDLSRGGTRRRSRSRWPGIFALKDAFKKANPILLEPIMKVEVVTPGRAHRAS